MGQSLVLAGQTITPAILNRIYGQADGISHTVNNTSYAQLSSLYTIPAGDAQDGTAYRLTTFGNGTTGTTEALYFSAGLAGSEIGTAPEISGSALATGAAAFDFEATVTLICVSNGTSGTWVASIRGVVTQSANAILPGTAADNTIPFAGCTHTAVTQDTTVGNTFGIYAKWAGTTGTPTLSCVGSLFEKVNPLISAGGRPRWAGCCTGCAVHTGTVNEPGPVLRVLVRVRQSDIGEVAIIGGVITLLRKHDCHEPGCWRLGRVHVDDKGTLSCWHHHPDGKPRPGHIRRAHERHKARAGAGM